jgi:gas vesicle protein
MTTTNKIIAALAVGAVAGAVLGVLFAPAKGSETRNKIREQGKKMADSLKENLAGCEKEIKKAAKNYMNEFEGS